MVKTSDTPAPENIIDAQAKLREMTELLNDLQSQIGYELPLPLRDTMQQLLFGSELTPAGARLLIEMLNREVANAKQSSHPLSQGRTRPGLEHPPLTWPLIERRKKQMS